MITRFYRTLQHLSIDIVFGAIILLHFFSKQYNISLECPIYIVLGASIWLIYTIDHLRDSRVAKTSSRERYAFHRKYWKMLRTAVILVFILTTICLFFLSTDLIIAGSILSLFCIGYVLFQSQLANKGLKELYVAIIYTLGILLAPITISQNFDIHSFFILLILSYLNLIIFSFFEHDVDIVDHFNSAATVFGKEKLEKGIIAWLGIGLAVGIAGLRYSNMYSGYLILVLLIFSMLMLNQVWALRNSRFRSIGDGVFLLPLLVEIA